VCNGLTHIDAYRLQVAKCHVEKEFKWNDKFEIVLGLEFFTPEGFLKFPAFRPRKPDGGYRTVFGPIFYHPSVVYERCDENMNRALARQTALRGDNDGELCKSQHYSLATSECLNSVVVPLVQERVHREFVNFDDEMEKLGYVNQPHPKRNERVANMQKLNDRGWWMKKWDGIVGCVDGCVKAAEWAKFGKYPRLFVSLGPYSIFAFGHMASTFKRVFSSFFVADCECEFLEAPHPKRMKEVFEKLIHGTQVLYYVYFSDDSCLAIQTSDGRRFVCNTDVNSCDSSHTYGIFDLLIRCCLLVPVVLRMVKLAVAQCIADIVIRSYSGDKTQVVKLKPSFPVLYSGSVLTTIINNIAQLLMFSILVDRINKYGPPKFSECRQFIQTAAEISGYNITIVGDGTPEQLQLLKHSPAIVDGQIHPYLNLGVILRMLGSCFGDLPGKGDMEMRAWMWNRSLVLGMVHSGVDCYLEPVRQFYKVGDDIKLSKELKSRIGVYFKDWILGGSIGATKESIARRYSLSVFEIEELFGAMVTNCHVHTLASQRIYEVDYEYKFSPVDGL